MEPKRELFTEAELQDINPFISMSKNKPNRSIIIRLLIYSIVLCVLTILVNIYAPLDVSELLGEEVIDEEFNQIIQEIEEDETLKQFQNVIQVFLSFFAPIVNILLIAVGLKLLTVIFRNLFKEKLSMQKLILISSVSYAFILIDTGIRLLYSIIIKEYTIFSLGSFPHYIDGLKVAEFPLNILSNINLFTILYCLCLAWGLQSLSKIKLLPSVLLIFTCYIVYVVSFSLIIG